MTQDNPPHIVVAPAPRDRNARVCLYVKDTTLRAFASFYFKSKLAEFFGLVRGGIDDRADGLVSTHAVFRGLLRDQKAPGFDEQIYVYVTAPEIGFHIFNEDRKRGHLPTVAPAPNNSVFVTYVLMREDQELKFHEGLSKEIRDQVAGEVLDWEWICWSPEDNRLPENWSTRYKEPLWRI
jgi:hypothetical protein